MFVSVGYWETIANILIVAGAFYAYVIHDLRVLSKRGAKGIKCRETNEDPRKRVGLFTLATFVLGRFQGTILPMTFEVECQ